MNLEEMKTSNVVLLAESLITINYASQTTSHVKLIAYTDASTNYNATI